RKTIWISAYRAGAMSLASYRHGRVIFAGNAAHAMPIFGVRGLNSGFEDADNLGWKLAAVIQGWSNDSLLASYDAERLHAFQVNAAAAIQSTEFMAPPTPGARLMRNAALSLSKAHAGIAQLANPRQTAAISYEDSPLNLPSDSFSCGPAPGAVMLEAPVQTARGAGHLTDLLGSHWTLLLFSADAWIDPQLDARLRQLQDRQPPLRTAVVAATGRPDGDEYRVLVLDQRQRAAHLHGADSGAVYLLRPDGHVAGRWLRQDNPQLLELLAQFPTTTRA
ncbi:MAG: FAD-dependent monooxygenase, partial [Quisquiliibacterium sp.]